MNLFLILGAFIAGVGMIFLVAAIILFAKGSAKKYSAQTTGMVVDMCKSAKSYNSGGDGNGVHFGVYVRTGNTQRIRSSRCPVFTYYVNGIQYTRADEVSYKTSMIKSMMQNPVTVYYDPHNPADARMNLKNAMGFIGVIFMTIAVIFIGMGILFMSTFMSIG